MKPYASYKPSGVPWLGGDIPSQWAPKRVKHVAAMQSGEGITAETIDESGTYPVYGGNGIRGFTTEKTHSGEFVLVGRQGALCGNVHHVVGDFWASEHAVVSTLYAGDKPRWAAYMLEFMNLGQYSMAAAQPGLAVDKIQQLRLPVPPPDEQQAIADYLDVETARIDTLIHEKDELIGLLREWRQSVIAEAVTKGLNKEALMKASGVAVLGEVPSHWEVKKIRYVLEAIGDVDHFMPESVDKGVPYLMTGDLKDLVSEVSLDECKQVAYKDYLALSKRIKSSKGDVVMARYATIGTAMYVDMDIDFLVSYSCVTLKPNQSNMSGLYLFQYMKSDAFLHGVENQINTNTQGNVGISDLQNVMIAVPPLLEQKAISEYLDTETTKIDGLVAHTHDEITLLKELRAATIADAVLGRIDVRGTAKKIAAFA